MFAKDTILQIDYRLSNQAIHANPFMVPDRHCKRGLLREAGIELENASEVRIELLRDIHLTVRVLARAERYVDKRVRAAIQIESTEVESLRGSKRAVTKFFGIL